ncbi:MAG: hypothetical protein WD018_05450 [Nitrosopumilaceae archaeon]
MTRAVNCPGCKQQIGIADPPEAQENIMLRQQIEQLQKEPKVQSFIPNYQCKDGSCGKIHENPRYTTRIKGKCRNCDQFSPRKEGECTFCKDEDGKRGEIEEISKDELTDLGIELPNE